VRLDLGEDGESLVIHTVTGERAKAVSQKPTVLIVDDNRDLLLFLERLLSQEGWTLLTAQSAGQARDIFNHHQPDVVLLDYMLGDDDGVKLGLYFQRAVPQTRVIIMTGGNLAPEEEMVCRERDFPVLFKPFLGTDVLNLIRSRTLKVSAA
jgi:DNA-binding NtrC family response regulator